MTTEIQSRVRTLGAELAAKLAEIEGRLAAGDDEESLYYRVAAVMDDCVGSLRELNLWGPENRLLSSELWNAAGDWLARGWLLNRARTKPRGYAGDYEMLLRIFANAMCIDPMGRLFDRYFQAEAAPQAVRNRMRMMAEWIGETVQRRGGGGGEENAAARTKIAIVGSAFGPELRAALLAMDESARRTVRATLLDLDPAALEFAREQLAPLLRAEQLEVSNMNLFRMPERPRLAAELAGTQLLLCPGLFDYLDDEAAARMLRCLAGQLAPGGRLIVFQFAPHNPTRAYMEWFGNWYLTYRDDVALRRVVKAADIRGVEIEYGAEELGVDLYVQITLSS